VTKVVRFDAPNIVRHGGVSGFSEEFNIVPIGPRRTRVLLRQRFPKGPILTTLLTVPGVRPLLQYLVRQWNYQIGLEDYCVMQGQAHNIDDLGAKNWDGVGVGDDLIIKFWKHTADALQHDGYETEYYTRYDGSTLSAAAAAAASTPIAVTPPTHAAEGQVANDGLLDEYVSAAPIADYPPINHLGFTTSEALLEAVPQKLKAAATQAKLPTLGALVGGSAGASLAASTALTAATADADSAGHAGSMLAQIALFLGALP